MYKVILILDKFFFKYEVGVNLTSLSRKKLPSKSSALLGLKLIKSFERLSQELFMPKFQYQNSTKWLCPQWLGLNLLKPRLFLGIIPKGSETKFHQNQITKSKVIHVQIPLPKWEKTKKLEKIFWVTKRGNKRITNRAALWISNRGKRDFKSG